MPNEYVHTASSSPARNPTTRRACVEMGYHWGQVDAALAAAQERCPLMGVLQGMWYNTASRSDIPCHPIGENGYAIF